MLSAKVSPPPRAKAQTGALRAKTAILLTWTMDSRPRSSPTFSRAGPQWRPFGQAAGRPALSDAGAAADSGKNSSSQLRASRFVVLSLEAFYDSSYTSSDEKTGYIWFLLYRMRGESQELSTSSVSLAADSFPSQGKLFYGKSPRRGRRLSYIVRSAALDGAFFICRRSDSVPDARRPGRGTGSSLRRRGSRPGRS